MSFTPPQPLNTAILFLVFNRLATTQQVFEAIREAKPPRLYIAADGARESIPGEAEKVMVVRDFILKNINWKCEIKTLFREENLGCKYAVSSAITWFFENEEMGIILEDDCLPKQEFFAFCENGLKKYKGDSDIAGIGGFVAMCNGEPFLSLHGSVWGWGTWRKVWSQYDIEAVLNQADLRFVAETSSLFSMLDKFSLSQRLEKEPANTWDYYWLFTRIKLRKFMVLPGAPLISNIGFDLVNSTNTKTEKPERLKRLELVRIDEKSVDHSQTIRNTNKLSSLDYNRLVGRFGQNKIAYEIFRSFTLSPIISARLLVIWVTRYFRKSLRV